MEDIFEYEQVPGIGNPELPSKQELSSLKEDLQDELRRANKKLKRAKKKGKSGKKFKRKIKNLKKKNKKLGLLLDAVKQQPIKGRWDGTIEKSVPELIKLATVVVDRKLPPPKAR